MRRSRSFILSIGLWAACQSSWVRAQDLRSLADGLPASIPVPALATVETAVGPGAGKLHPDLILATTNGGSKGIGGGANGEAIPVVLIADSESNVADLERRIAGPASTVTGTVGNAILARMPASAITSLASSSDHLYYAALQPEIYPLEEPGAGSGDVARAIGADTLHARGITGKGIKVGVLDFGFLNLSRLVNSGRLPRPKAVKAWNESGNAETGTDHGTWCVQVVHDVAPDAELYLAAMGGGSPTLDQFAMAAQWLADQGVRVISFSGGTHEGPHDGRALMDAIVDRLTQRYGILWVNAAGNEGSLHWSGLADHVNRDGWVEVTGSRPFLLLRPAGETLSLLVTWDDWGQDPRLPQSFQDFDAFLFRYEDVRGGHPLPLARSVNVQNGRAFPIEKIGPVKVNHGETFVLGLQAKHVTRPVRVHVFALTKAELEPRSPEGSIIVPATARSALAVGAINPTSRDLEPYSSRGPTDDCRGNSTNREGRPYPSGNTTGECRVKPDVTAPDKFSSTGPPGSFDGTSAASPAAAGLAALLWQMSPDADQATVRKRLLAAATPIGAPHPNNAFGYGEIAAPGAPKRRTLPSVETLDYLRSHEGDVRDPDLRLKIGFSPGDYPIGFHATLSFSASAPCHCLLYYHDPGGWSLRYSEETPVSGEKDLGSLVFVDPPGPGELILIGSRTPIAWDRFDRNHIPPLTVTAVHFSAISSPEGKK